MRAATREDSKMRRERSVSITLVRELWVRNFYVLRGDEIPNRYLELWGPSSSVSSPAS